MQNNSDTGSHDGTKKDLIVSNEDHNQTLKGGLDWVDHTSDDDSDSSAYEDAKEDQNDVDDEIEGELGQKHASPISRKGLVAHWSFALSSQILQSLKARIAI